ncbi:hypothetical protein TIFTF001_033433 [Ficus carica]|uniref:Uncharacterized protein n=1 Tax=Ficus carica TaxID=3494 RepID=A0AA88DY96_FICCA|nr:hypothetical protein TIFTF001_033433 [Ficus carica]
MFRCKRSGSAYSRLALDVNRAASAFSPSPLVVYHRASHPHLPAPPSQ